MNKLKKKEKEISQMRVKCKCGCVTIMRPVTDWCICRWCKHKLYRTKEIEFRYKMMEELKNDRRKYGL